MPLFGKKKNDEASSPNIGAKNRADLGQMFDESVLESVREQLRENEAFKVGDGRYAILILDLDKYGFKDSKGKNTSQGEFIEYTKNSNIHAYIPATGYLDGENSLGKEIVGIVPDSTTLENLEEIALTREAEYYVAILDEDLNTTITDKVMSLTDAQAVIEDEKEISDFIGDIDTSSNADDDDEDDNEESEDEGISTSSYDDDEDEPEEDSDEDIEDDNDIEEDDYDREYDEDEPGDDMAGEDYDDSGDDEYNEGAADVEDTTGDDFVDDIESMNGSEEYDEDEEEYEDEDEVVDMPLPGANPQNMSYTEEQFNSAYSRKFYSEDLGITFNSEPFDAIFANRKPFKHLDDNCPEDGEHAWLNKQLNQQARDANTQLDTLHAENLQEMRARYMTTISRFCDDIVKEVDPSNKDTEFYHMREDLNKQKQDLIDNSDREIQKKKDELTRKFENDVKNVRERAANEAETSYRNKFTAQHERELADTEAHYKRDIEAACREAEQTIHDQRRETAKRKLDTAITETLVQIEKEYNIALQAYNELYQQFAKQIEETYEKYRQEEIDRSKTLALQLARNDEVARVSHECVEKIGIIKSEYDIKAQNNEDDKNKTIVAANERVSYMETQCKERLDDERRRVTELQQKLDDMVHDVKIEGERKDREYEARIGELKQENKIWQDQYDTLDASHKRQHHIATILVVAIAIITISVGFIIGMYSGLDKAAKNNAATEARVVTEVINTENLGE